MKVYRELCEIEAAGSADILLLLEEDLSVGASFRKLSKYKRRHLASSLFELGRIYERRKSPTLLIGRKSRAARQLSELRKYVALVRARPATAEGRIGLYLLRAWLNRKDIDPFCVFAITNTGEDFEFEAVKNSLLTSPPSRQVLKNIHHLLNDVLKRGARLTNDSRGRFAPDDVARQFVFAFSKHFQSVTGMDPLCSSPDSHDRSLFNLLLFTFGECLVPPISSSKLKLLISQLRDA